MTTEASISSESAATSASAPLRGPDGRITAIEGNSQDISVFATLFYNDGEFEPYLLSMFESLIRPDWVCMDIGANIGVHTLNMAALSSRVIAFEAALRSFNYLQKNCMNSEFASKIAVERLALWNETSPLHIAAPLELEGCAFIAQGDISESEERVRSANPTALIGRDMHLTLDTVSGVRLDDWSTDHPLDRLDLIKIDVEGSEMRVLEGAAQTLDRFRPILITEYNVNSAKAYFGSKPDEYYRYLRKIYRRIRVINDDGTLSAPIEVWEELAERVAGAKFWADLLCEPAPR